MSGEVIYLAYIFFFKNLTGLVPSICWMVCIVDFDVNLVFLQWQDYVFCFCVSCGL